ncbi:alpha-amylase family glycosyl hydrolase [Arenibaculum sp.]|jgi:alpha-glucosidase|uniref:alpha-amylase family glycosyl hydrolase n=1 Tax=Arenibaculum sp. TaxID=2865862 RepID=UPI002E150D0A|nr:alpha-amylase family glycosyl hydrolase [Arenibaculum sp.]
MTTHDTRWWQHGIVYQIYPRSFQDTDGDGIGDLAGIVSRLDYLSWLGVDAIWLSPVFPSPMKDFGYDISDFCAIHPIFGTLDEFDRLVTEAHRRGMRLILDYVPNHTSDQHPWFQASRSSRDDPKRDWYIWRDPGPDGGPPNNWLSTFGGSGWEFDEATGQYYYHAFLKEQPDLNWRDPEVVRAMHDALRFWLDRGVDGFRVDVLWHLIKDDRFRDNPINPEWRPGHDPYQRLVPVYTTDRPEVLDVVAGLRSVVDEYDDRLLIGEIYLPLERLVAYYGTDLEGVHLPFNFQLVEAPWHARSLARMIEDYEEALPPGGWPNWVLGNHDKPRIASRVGTAQARVAAMMLLTLRGTPTMYYGDEIGMHDVPIPPDRIQDPFEKNVPGLGLGRDPQRTPMQWEPGRAAGFSTAEPWLPVPGDADTVNVATQEQAPDSMLALYRNLVALRRGEPALNRGSFVRIEAEGDVLVYLREHEGRCFAVLLNLGDEPHEAHGVPAGAVVLSTGLDRSGEPVEGTVSLHAGEGLIVEVGRRGR